MWFTIIFGIPILLMAIWKPWDSIVTIVLSTFLSIIAMILTATVVTRTINQHRLERVEEVITTIKDKPEEERKLLRYYIAKFRLRKGLGQEKGLSDTEKAKFKKLKNKVTVPDNEESPAVILGMGGLYAIINGFGITEALTKYAEAFGGNAEAFGGTIPDLLPYSLRLVTFLVTIVPFIHGFILTFSNKWYYDIESGETHYEWAFAFFIAVFIQTVLLFFVAFNVHKFNLFIDMLWALMIFNIPWLAIQIWWILSDKIKIVHVFPKQWIILNFITASFLSIFIFEPELLTTAQNDVWIIGFVFSVLFFRAVADYIVGWKDLYNRTPDPEEAVQH